ncbi:MAG: malate synthase A [Gemmatimonadota bacterium]
MRRAGDFEITGGGTAASERVLTSEALAYVERLQREFDPVRRDLLARRAARAAEIRAGARPAFPAEAGGVRSAEWRVAPAPADLEDRRVEITGPAAAKMMINALNSGASVFMADFEDSLSPTWENLVEGQASVMDAVRRTLEFASPGGKRYHLGERLATLLVRPRGWHLDEPRARLGGRPVSASLFDFGLWFFHNARELLERGTGPYLYLPKLESRLEARLWNDVFQLAQDALGIPRGSVRATVLIETIHAAFEMEEILHELREHAAGLNAGRWDYIFSVLKTFGESSEFVLPDRAQVTMTVPFMRAYTQLLVRTCHRRGAHAIGGMSAFIPSRRDARVNEVALARVREDKQREAEEGFDGTWVAHPDLVPVARQVFDDRLGDAPHQKHRLREDVRVAAEDLLDVRIPDGGVTSAGVRQNVAAALQYLAAWLGGSGAVAIHDLMEDTATAEISRAQLWQWLRLRVPLPEGERVTPELYRGVREAELAELAARGDEGGLAGEAARLLDRLVLDDGFTAFLTLAAQPVDPQAPPEPLPESRPAGGR